MSPDTGPTVTHLMRAPIVGGSELETLTLTRCVTGVRHRVVFPARFARIGPGIADRFGADVELRAVRSPEREFEERPPELLHVQFPFVLVGEPAGHDSVLELRRLPEVPRLFTVHAAVNVPVVERLHYVFHTEALRASFAGRIPDDDACVLPSPVEPPRSDRVPDRAQRRGDRVRVLWASRNDDAKFHPEVGAVCARILARCPQAELRFVGRPATYDLPSDPRISVTPCPVADLAREYAAADLFWFYPHPRVAETWSRTTTEAMAWALPCVVAAHGAMRAQVEDGDSGRVVSDLDACSEAMVELIGDAPLRHRWGMRGRRRAADFFARSIAGFADLYHRLSNDAQDP